MTEMNSPVGNHYDKGDIECITVLEQLARQGVDFRALHVIRYLWRAEEKGQKNSDLDKAENYIHRMRTGHWLPAFDESSPCRCYSGAGASEQNVILEAHATQPRHLSKREVLEYLLGR